MSEFEKWNEGDYKEESCCSHHIIPCDECEKLRKDGWKAALEWVLNNWHGCLGENGQRIMDELLNHQTDNSTD